MKNFRQKKLSGELYIASKSDIAELCPSIGTKSVELALKQLVEEGILLKKGSGRATFYVRSDSVGSIIP